MKGTRIRWAEHTWNPITGCSKISPGCDNCYAETLMTRYGPASTSFPVGFEPTYKPQKLGEPAKWLRNGGPARIFCNSLSDPFHEAFTDEQRDSIFDVMLDVPQHDYLVLTKRPQAMRRYFMPTSARAPDEAASPGYLARRGLDRAPAQMWLGCSIESDRYTFRARHLTAIPAVVHFLSLEPLLGPLPSLDLNDIQWVIVGGESGPGWRPMDLDWARDLRDRCRSNECELGDPHGWTQRTDYGTGSEDDAHLECRGTGIRPIAFYYKQGAAIRTEMHIELDGVLHEEYPLAHPADRDPFDRDGSIGRYVGRHAATTPVTLR